MQISRVNVSLVWSIPPQFPRHHARYRQEASILPRALCSSPGLTEKTVLVSGPTGTWPLIDQELQTNGLAPKIKTQRGCSLPTSHLPTTAPLSHTQNKALSVPEQGRRHKLDNPNQSTVSLTAHRLGQGEREGSRGVRLWSVRGKSESDSQSSAMRAPFESLQGVQILGLSPGKEKG